MSKTPILQGLTPPFVAHWETPSRLRASLGEVSTLEATSLQSAGLWLRARATSGDAQWFRFVNKKVDWTPNQTGLWTLELAQEISLGKCALIPHQTIVAIVEEKNFASLRSYNLIPRINGEIKDWPLLLPRIKRMGFNAIWLLPVCAMGQSKSPYSTSDPMEIDASLAPDGKGWQHLENFADACKKENVALGIDLVFNHVAPDGAFAKAHPQWLKTSISEPDGLHRAGWWEGVTFHAWRDLIQLRYENQSVPELDALLNYWKTSALKWMALSSRAGLPLLRLDNAHSTPKNLLDTVLPSLRGAYKNLSILGEFFSNDASAREHFVFFPRH